MWFGVQISLSQNFFFFYCKDFAVLDKTKSKAEGIKIFKKTQQISLQFVTL